MEAEGSLSIHKSPPLVPTLSQVNPFHALPNYFLKMNFNIVLPSTPKLFEVGGRVLRDFLIRHLNAIRDFCFQFSSRVFTGSHQRVRSHPQLEIQLSESKSPPYVICKLLNSSISNSTGADNKHS
jgi:hypothetical protein